MWAALGCVSGRVRVWGQLPVPLVWGGGGTSNPGGSLVPGLPDSVLSWPGSSILLIQVQKYLLHSIKVKLPLHSTRICSAMWAGHNAPPWAAGSRKSYLRKINSLRLFGRPICVCCHPWEVTPGTDEDIWRCSLCHICWCLNTFTSALSLAAELPCITRMLLWSAPLPRVPAFPASTRLSEPIRRQQSWAVGAGPTGALAQGVWKNVHLL